MTERTPLCLSLRVASSYLGALSPLTDPEQLDQQTDTETAMSDKAAIKPESRLSPLPGDGECQGKRGKHWVLSPADRTAQDSGCVSVAAGRASASAARSIMIAIGRDRGPRRRELSDTTGENPELIC